MYIQHYVYSTLCFVIKSQLKYNMHVCTNLHIVFIAFVIYWLCVCGVSINATVFPRDQTQAIGLSGKFYLLSHITGPESFNLNEKQEYKLKV